MALLSVSTLQIFINQMTFSTSKRSPASISSGPKNYIYFYLHLIPRRYFLTKKQDCHNRPISLYSLLAKLYALAQEQVSLATTEGIQSRSNKFRIPNTNQQNSTPTSLAGVL